MASNLRIFVESSLSHQDAKRWVSVDALAPSAKRGDILRAVKEGIKHIVLIDGYFGFTPSVWHKEILYALSQGVKVTGAASMGALRAVELAPYGMQGVGDVYRYYAAHPDTDDAEVATFFHGEKSVATVPLINIRLSLGDITEEAKLIIQALAAIHYTERTWVAIKTALTNTQWTSLTLHYQAYKAADARVCLSTLDDLANPVKPPSFVHTFFFQRLYDEVFFPNERAVFLAKAEKALVGTRVPTVCHAASRIRELAKLLDTSDFSLCHKLIQQLLECDIRFNMAGLPAALTRWRMREQLVQGEVFKQWCLDRALNFAMLEQTFMDYFLLRRMLTL